MTYKYEPNTEEVGRLCEMLDGKFKGAKFNFNLEQGGLLRLKIWSRGKYFEKLLRNEDSPEGVIEAAAIALSI